MVAWSLTCIELHFRELGNFFYKYRRRWLLSVGAYSFSQQENERLTANMRLIGIPLINMGGVIIINASGVQYFGILRVKRLTNIL